jgi:CBS domain-containing protein
MTESPTPEGLMVAVAESRAVPPSLVSSIEAVARSRLLKVSVDTSLAQVASVLSATMVSLVVVCDAADAVVGVITETVLIRQLGFGRADVFTTRADEVMIRDFTVCAATDSLPDVLAMMHTRGLAHVLIVKAENQPVGVLIARDGLRALLAAGNYEEALLRNYVTGVGYQ